MFTTEHFLEKGEKAFSSERFEEAAVLFEKARETSSDRQKVLHFIGLLQQKQNSKTALNSNYLSEISQFLQVIKVEESPAKVDSLLKHMH